MLNETFSVIFKHRALMGLQISTFLLYKRYKLLNKIWHIYLAVIDLGITSVFYLIYSTKYEACKA